MKLWPSQLTFFSNWRIPFFWLNKTQKKSEIWSGFTSVHIVIYTCSVLLFAWTYFRSHWKTGQIKVFCSLTLSYRSAALFNSVNGPVCRLIDLFRSKHSFLSSDRINLSPCHLRRLSNLTPLTLWHQRKLTICLMMNDDKANVLWYKGFILKVVFNSILFRI